MGRGRARAITRAWPTFRYVVADVFTDTPLTGNQLAVFTDARGLDDETMQALALEIGLLGDRLRPARRSRAAPRGSGSSTPAPRCRSPAIRRSAPPSCSARRCSSGVIELETGVGIVPSSLERDESGRIVFGRMTQPVPRVEAGRGPGAVLAAVGAARSLLPVELLRQRRAAHPRRRSRRTSSAALRPDGDAHRRVRRHGRQLRRRDGAARGGTGCSGEHGEDPATGSAAGPIACHLARHGLVAWGEEIVIAQGVEIGRPSTLHARAEGGEGLIDAVEVGGAAVIVARGEFRF